MVNPVNSVESHYAHPWQLFAQSMALYVLPTIHVKRAFLVRKPKVRETYVDQRLQER
jgi:hypothetical protein